MKMINQNAALVMNSLRQRQRISKSLFLKALIAAAFGASFTTASAAPDPYVGDYVKDCPKAQCTIEITKEKGKTYNLRFTAADTMDADKVLCRADIPMRRDRLEFTVNENYDDALSGTYKSDPLIWLLAFDDGSIHFYIENAPCGGFNMAGEYVAFGDK
ncbi:hypothetical protein C3731_17175 [Brucella oryzae]|uniref:Uncharacterized protein n=2 Tax=Brucella oryzae TaxID=335286 RepID=A0A2S7IWI2_9HYPH|nr:hypothetical protein C3731_17175 [Brucella oryzae]